MMVDIIGEYDDCYGILTFYYYFNEAKYKIIDELLIKGNINYQIPSKNKFRHSNKSLFGCTALHIAIIKKDYENFKLLIDNGADYIIKNGNSDTVVHCIVKKIYANANNPSELRKFLDLVLSAHIKFQNHSNPQNSNGMSHFHAACIRSRTKLVKLFLKNGVSVNETVDEKSEVFAGYTSLHFAVRFGSFLTAKLLLHRGADINCKDAQGLTPLQLLIKRNMEIIDWVNMGKRDCYDQLKKEYEKNEKIITMIMAKMQSGVHQDNSLQFSNLHVACTLQDSSMVKQFCKEKVNLNEPVCEKSSLWSGYTPLHFAAHFNVNSAKWLLRSGANFLMKNSEGITPLDLCLQRYDVDVLRDFMKLIPAWKSIKFYKTKISLSEAFSAMKNEKSFNKFLISLDNVNMSIPLTSPILPGFTLLHLAVVLSERHQLIDNVVNKYLFYKSFDDENVGVHFNCSAEDEKIYVQRVKMCLDLGADAAIADSNGSTPLHLAFKLQRESAVNLLLDSYEGKVDLVDKGNLRYLHIACAAGNKTAVENLILTSNNCVNCPVTSQYKYRTNISAGSTPLHIAVSNRNTEIVRLLIFHGADVYVQDSNGLTPIHQIFVQGIKDHNEESGLNEIASILLFPGDLRECETSFGLSHLHVASYMKKVIAIERLLKNGTMIDATISCKNLALNEELKFIKNFDGFTPLHLALKNECEEIVESLVRSGANVLAVPLQIGYKLHVKNSDFLARKLIKEFIAQERIKNSFGLTDLHAACATLDVQRVKELLKQGADPNAQVHSNSPLWPGDTALHFVIIKRNNYPKLDIRTIIDVLLDYGANVTLANSKNLTAILRAHSLASNTNKMFSCPQRLREAHTDFNVNPTNDEGLSHFHLACVNNQVTKVEAFLKHGVVNVNQTVDFSSNHFPGCSPLHLAAITKFDDIVDLLLKYGANVHKRHFGYRNPVHEAASRLGHLRNPSERAILNIAKIGKELQSHTIMKQTPLELFLFRKRSTTDTFRLFLENDDRVNLFNPITEEGFIAIAILHDSSIEELLQNTYFAAVLNAPEANGPDDLGRTPIHNVVSLRGSEAPIEVHLKALLKLIEIGFEIDRRDATGRTALYLAVQHFNFKGFTALVKLGADINIADDKGQTPLSYVAKWFEKPYSDTKESQRKILEICLDRIHKMEETGLYISSLNISMEKTVHKYWKVDSDVNGVWQAEKNKLAIEKIDSQKLNLWGFLSETGAVSSYPKSRPSERQAIDKFFQTNTDRILEEYPQFGGLLLLQHRKAQARVDLIKIARDSLGHSSNYILPVVCCDYILQYCNNQHLKILIKK